MDGHFEWTTIMLHLVLYMWHVTRARLYLFSMHLCDLSCHVGLRLGEGGGGYRGAKWCSVSNMVKGGF